MGTRKMHIIIDKIFLSSKFKIVSTVDHSWAWAVYNLGSNHSLSHYYRDEFWQGTWNLPLFLSWFSARGNSENCSLQIHCHLSAATFCGIHSSLSIPVFPHWLASLDVTRIIPRPTSAQPAPCWSHCKWSRCQVAKPKYKGISVHTFLVLG